MPLKRGAAAKAANLQKACEASPANKPDLESALSHAQHDLDAAQSKIDSLVLELEQAKTKQTETTIQLDKARDKIKNLESQVNAVTQKQKNIYQDLRAERHARQRAVKHKKVLDDKVSELKTDQVEKIKQIKELEKKNKNTSQRVGDILAANEHLQSGLSTMMSQFSSDLELVHQKLKFTRSELSESRTKVYDLKRKALRAAEARERVIQRTKAKVTKERTTLYLLKKGAYSEDTRNLVRILIQANVSAKNIMHVIESVLATAGIYESEFTRIRSYKHLGLQIDREWFNGVLYKL